MKTVDFSETIAASDLKVGRFRQLTWKVVGADILLEDMRVLKVKVIS